MAFESTIPYSLKYSCFNHKILTSMINRWTGRVSFEEMAVSRSLVRSLEDGLKEWQEEIDMLNW
jgi:hypothetical protein